jgi:hypothetical protein
MPLRPSSESPIDRHPVVVMWLDRRGREGVDGEGARGHLAPHTPTPNFHDSLSLRKESLLVIMRDSLEQRRCSCRGDDFSRVEGGGRESFIHISTADDDEDARGSANINPRIEFTHYSVDICIVDVRSHETMDVYQKIVMSRR